MVVLIFVFGSSDPWFVIFSLISDLCLVLCCDIYRSTLISIMYPACMITVHDRKSRALQPRCVDAMPWLGRRVAMAGAGRGRRCMTAARGGGTQATNMARAAARVGHGMG